MLTLTNIHKQYDSAPVLSAVDLAVEDGEIVCLLGPSGCGKTTLLRIVAGLEQADQGDLRIDDQDLTRIPVHRRRFGLMFQEFALFRDMTVGDNIAFGLRMAGADRPTIARRVDEMLALVNLDGYADRSVFGTEWRGTAAGSAGAQPGPQPATVDARRAAGQPGSHPARN
ncbi:MAG: ATP-binding cassette domain-containing protein [Caldilineaceae bacterium]